ncbi:hypothetical protein [Streptomyces termitum]|uniref:hypothetical protein n=1 Tax=Streptomyces termitum TaxID=67368 RepID=UPI0033A179AD
MRLALAAHQPSKGRLTIHPTPAVRTGAYLAHDLLRGMGKHLMVSESSSCPGWTNDTVASWRSAAAWTAALKITHITICRAHALTPEHWAQLLALSVRTGIRLTLVCNGPLPHKTAKMLGSIEYRLIDDARTASAHWRYTNRTGVRSGYRWWQHRAAFPLGNDEPWITMPPQPLQPLTVQATPLPVITTPAVVLPTPPMHDTTHPHTQLIADRIHTRIAHPVHAACVALRSLTGYHTQQLKALHRHTSSGLPPIPPWVCVLLDAAYHYASLRGHPDTSNPLATHARQHADIDQSLYHCRLVPSVRKPGDLHPVLHRQEVSPQEVMMRLRSARRGQLENAPGPGM